MIINFNEIQEDVLLNFKGGEKTFFARRFMSDGNIMMYDRLEPGASIGTHTHEGDCEIVYILQGKGETVYDGEVLKLEAGLCHYCPEGHTHNMKNVGEEDLVFFAVVAKQ